MKQIVVLSGKGGTGKTVMTGALAALVDNKVMVDCDVDAADLHLLLTPRIMERHEFKSGQKAHIDQRACVRCGRCLEVCRFGAVTKNLLIDAGSCEGCGLCARICPSHAITMENNLCGEWFVSQTRFGTMVHARLGVGEENSGKLVAQIRQKAKEIAQEADRDWVIIDGPPGIGCPVMASLSGVNAVLLVTEPTCSGLHDAGRVIDLGKHFKIPVLLVVNKWDVNPAVTEQIEKYCLGNGVVVTGRVPFDRAVVDAVVAGKTIMEGNSLGLKSEILKIWESLKGSMS
ncbi:MAG: ATP-binding protein [Candidatus Omnitrophota bacterium]